MLVRENYKFLCNYCNKIYRLTLFLACVIPSSVKSNSIDKLDLDRFVRSNKHHLD